MIQQQIARCLQFLLLAALQVLIFNQIRLFGCATPLLYVAFILYTPLNASRVGTLLWAFAMGITMDIFNNTPGVAAASMTFLGLLQPVILQLMVTKDVAENFTASAKSFGWHRYSRYVLLLVILYLVVFFALEYFSFYNGKEFLKTVGGCTVLTVITILLMEMFRGKKSRN